MRDLASEVRSAMRSLRRSPALTTVVILTLAVGIGANAAIFSLVNAMLLRPLPVWDPHGLVNLSEATADAGRIRGPLPAGKSRMRVYSLPLYQQLRAQHRVFSGLVAVDGPDNRYVSDNYFQVLGVPAALGRTFGAGDTADAPAVVVLSHDYWRRRFGGDPGIVGRRIDLEVNDASSRYTVVGVAGQGFSGTRLGVPAEFWLPLAQAPARFLERDHHWLFLLGRLQPGISWESAESAANTILQQHLSAETSLSPDARQGIRIMLESGAAGITRVRLAYRDQLLALMAGVVVLFAIVCLNVGHLMLARTAERRRELSIRLALGATRVRLVRSLLVEGLLLAVLGGLSGVLAARWLTDGLVALAMGAESRLGMNVGLDWRVVVFTLLLGAIVALVMGLVPAWRATSPAGDLQAALRAGGQAITPRSHRLPSRLLLILQVGLSLVLLVGAGLLRQTLDRLRAVDKGLDEEHVLLLGVRPSNLGLPREALAALYDDLLRRVAAVPGVRHASLSHYPPLSHSTMGTNVLVPGSQPWAANVEVVGPDHLEALGMTLVRGRGLSPSDRAGAPLVAVVNEAWARRAGGEVLGRRFTLDPTRPPRTPQPFEVVGVVRDGRMVSLRRSPTPMAFLALAQVTGTAPATLAVRTAPQVAEPTALVPLVEQALREAHPGLAIRSVTTTGRQIDRMVHRERLLATLSSAFGLIALFLVSLGIYGVLGQWATRRTREIGVRMALGATGGRVRWLVLRQALALVIAGLALGLPAVAGSTRLLRTVLYEVSPMDPTTLALAVLAMFAVAAAAAFVPALRASLVHPMIALRTE